MMAILWKNCLIITKDTRIIHANIAIALTFSENQKLMALFHATHFTSLNPRGCGTYELHYTSRLS
jgi:hypothetical protein